MSRLPTRWNTFVVVLALSIMVGCQGLSTSKSNLQSNQNSLLGTLTAGPASVSFGNVQVGTSQTQSDTLSNTGVTNLTITQAAVTGTGFSTTGLSLPLTLIPGQGVSFNVVFAPQSAGSASGTLALTNNGSSSTLNVALSGTAVAAGSLSATPTSLSFGSRQVGTSQTQTETLKNIGGDSLTISQATVSGAGFSYSGLSLPLTLAANQSTTFGVVFAPTAAGASGGSVSLTISGSSTTLDIALSGAGVAPATLTATPSSLIFTNITVGQNQAQTETIKNVGGESATISQATVAGTGFSISGISAPVTLTPGQSASFSVTFAPQSAGSSFPGSVVVDSNASNPSLSVVLTGSAVAQSVGTLSASSVNVGSVVVGTSGTQTGTLSASGASVSVSSVSLSGTNPSEFSISGLTFPVTVTTTQPLTFTVKFTPGATGTASASASFASTASNTPTAASVTGTGTAAPVHTVSLMWTASTTTGVTSYNVYRAIYSGSACGSYTNIGSSPSPTTAYTDSVVADGTTYCYATTAIDPSGESGYSNVSQAMIPAP
ncbi:MAG: choice-of-anchor D domain-containing protein [Candidatus Sulfotelmatobacter sp.]